jgi:Mn2+-dependent serine/threonine protein kinase
MARGAEADLYEVDWFGMRAVVKHRKPKRYRDPGAGQSDQDQEDLERGQVDV